jgi:predicted nucleic acid-binding protein
VSEGSAPALVFDTGPMRHFALQGWLRILEVLAVGRRVVIPQSVAVEIQDQARDEPALLQILEADWIQVDRGTDTSLLIAFAGYERRLVDVGTKNRGECGVLALGRVYGHEVVLDDKTARTIAAEDGIAVTTTLALLCQAIRSGLLNVALVEKIADDLLAGDYYLPLGADGFRLWALQQDLITYEEYASLPSHRM